MPASIDTAGLFQSVDAAAEIAQADERCIRSGAILYFQMSPGQIGYLPVGPHASVTDLITTRMLDPQATIVCKELRVNSLWERRRCSDDG